MIIYLGIPIVFGLFFLWGGVLVFKSEAEQAQVPAYDPNRYRS